MVPWCMCPSKNGPEILPALLDESSLGLGSASMLASGHQLIAQVRASSAMAPACQGIRASLPWHPCNHASLIHATIRRSSMQPCIAHPCSHASLIHAAIRRSSMQPCVAHPCSHASMPRHPCVHARASMQPSVEHCLAALCVIAAA